MFAGRLRLLTLAAMSMIAGLAQDKASFAQGQSEPPTVRDFCIKVAPGKGTEYEAFLQDVTLPLARARADAGEFAWFVAESAVVPAGSSAPCDYRLVYGYKGLPPEVPSKDVLAAGLKRAKLTMSVDDMVARRSALTQLVSVEIWGQIDGIGPPQEKGSYVRLNHYNAKYGEMGEWTRLERTYWKAVMDAWLKAGGKGSWSVNGLWMPSGDRTPYNGLTVDIFPDWNSLIRGVPFNELWSKVHPDMPFTEFFNRLERVRSVHDVEVYKIVEVVRAK
jgi:hypothetical protein